MYPMVLRHPAQYMRVDSKYSTAYRARVLSHRHTHKYTILTETLYDVHTLQHTATHCNALHYTATHCNTMQHTATQKRLYLNFRWTSLHVAAAYIYIMYVWGGYD